MRLFLITGKQYSGELKVLYNEDELLDTVDFKETSMNYKQRHVILKHIPAHLTEIETAFKSPVLANLTVIESEYEETFDMFWNTFNNKRNKADALKLWNKLKKIDQVKCRIRIAAYMKYIDRKHRTGFTALNQMYPDTWIRGRHWEDEWETCQ